MIITDNLSILIWRLNNFNLNVSNLYIVGTTTIATFFYLFKNFESHTIKISVKNVLVFSVFTYTLQWFSNIFNHWLQTIEANNIIMLSWKSHIFDYWATWNAIWVYKKNYSFDYLLNLYFLELPSINDKTFEEYIANVFGEWNSQKVVSVGSVTK